MTSDKLRRIRQLAQRTDGDTNNHTLYEPSKGVQGLVYMIVVCNYGSADAAYTIFHDADGNTYAAVSTLFDACSLPANSTEIIDFRVGLPVNGNDDGTIGVKSDTSSAITFTAYGEEITK
jgi:hypothetical protein